MDAPWAAGLGGGRREWGRAGGSVWGPQGWGSLQASAPSRPPPPHPKLASVVCVPCPPCDVLALLLPTPWPRSSPLHHPLRHPRSKSWGGVFQAGPPTRTLGRPRAWCSPSCPSRSQERMCLGHRDPGDSRHICPRASALQRAEAGTHAREAGRPGFRSPLCHTQGQHPQPAQGNPGKHPYRLPSGSLGVPFKAGRGLLVPQMLCQPPLIPVWISWALSEILSCLVHQHLDSAISCLLMAVSDQTRVRNSLRPPPTPFPPQGAPTDSVSSTAPPSSSPTSRIHRTQPLPFSTREAGQSSGAHSPVVPPTPATHSPPGALKQQLGSASPGGV